MTVESVYKVGKKPKGKVKMTKSVKMKKSSK